MNFSVFMQSCRKVFFQRLAYHLVCKMQLPGAVSLDTKKKCEKAASQVSDSKSFFTQTLQRLESVTKMDRQMAVRMMKIAIRSVYSVVVVVPQLYQQQQQQQQYHYLWWWQQQQQSVSAAVVVVVALFLFVKLESFTEQSLPTNNILFFCSFVTHLVHSVYPNLLYFLSCYSLAIFQYIGNQ